VVLASGYITEGLRAKAPAAGIRELIYKPNTVDDLCGAVVGFATAQGGEETSSCPGLPALASQPETPFWQVEPCRGL
jgi:hypothetical protein